MVSPSHFSSDCPGLMVPVLARIACPARLSPSAFSPLAMASTSDSSFFLALSSRTCIDVRRGALSASFGLVRSLSE